jgi:hypothetical protein
MRPKVTRRVVAPPPRTNTRPSSQVLGVISLLIVGALLGLTVERLVEATLVTGTPGTATESTAPGDSNAAASDVPGSSDVPSESPVSPVLEAQIPATIDGTALTTQSATDASSISGTPNGRALDAAVVSLGKLPSDLEIAIAYDGSGVLDLSILGFRIAGIEPAILRPILIDTWLASNAPGITTSQVDVSGTPTTEVSYGDCGPNEWVFVHQDSVFIVETADATLAADTVAAITGSVPAASTGTSPTASPAESPGPSPSGC